VIKEVILNASVPKVWKAITDRDDMKQWYFDIEEFRPEPGSSFTSAQEMKKEIPALVQNNGSCAQ